MKFIISLLLPTLINEITATFFHHKTVDKTKFPEDFIFGVSTSAYQIEGAWNEDGKGESIWDHAAHKHPERFQNASTGDISTDHYHKYKEDVQIVKNLGVNFYRFSISWPRILPNGRINQVSEAGVKHYSDLIDELIANDIEPHVTIYHWDLPQTLQEEGGWLNDQIIDIYVDYAEYLFQRYGDRVKFWSTFNEFLMLCENSYSLPKYAPFINHTGIGGYNCFHNVIIAHAKTYQLYQNKFKHRQKGQIGFSINSIWPEPLNKENANDRLAAELYMQFNFNWYAHPVIYGDYPIIMRILVAKNSKQEGFKKSRLPAFTHSELNLIKGSIDFLGLNHYTTVLATLGNESTFTRPSLANDCGVVVSQDPSWQYSKSARWLAVVPQGFRELLVWIKEHLKNVPVLITENGFSTTGEINDTDRIEYYRQYMGELLKAIHEDKCNIIGYAAWSLLDNFEWGGGYGERYGLVNVDFDSPNRTRTPRSSYYMYQNVIKTKSLNETV